jgi:flagellin
MSPLPIQNQSEGTPAMASINTNVAAMTALQSLNSTMKGLEVTQNRISTGRRVDAAADNAAYWSIATTMRSDHGALSAVKDALNLGSSTIDVAYTGLKSAIDVTSQIKTKLTAAAQPGIDRGKIQAEVTQLQKQLKSISDSAVFSGQNWLSVDSSTAGFNATKSIVSSYQHDAAGAVTVGTINLDISGITLFDANASSFTSQTVYDVSFTIASTSDIFDEIDGKFDAGAADGDTATITMLIDGTEQDVTATKNGTDYDITFSSLRTYTDTDTPTLQVKGSTDAETAVAIAVATHTNFVEASGILDAVDGITGVSVFNLDISALTDSTTDLSTLNAMTKQVDAAIGSMTAAAADLGSVKSRVSLQQSFVTSLMSSIDKGIGALVDADMTEESTRLQALQVQQQLGVQALSIANQSTQAILSLFRG